MKKIIALILIAVMMLSTMVACASVGDVYALEFSELSDGTYSVKVKANEKLVNLKKISIPAKYNGKDVTEISDDAFNGAKNLKTVTIPDTVKKIGASAFEGCAALESVTIPDSVVSLGRNAFAYCAALKSVTIGEGVELINDYTFASCILLDKITIGSRVKSIGEGAFGDCDSLVDITLPNSVTKIGAFAFSGCDKLVNISIPNSVVYIGEEAFEKCNNIDFTEYNNGKYLGNSGNSYVVLMGVMDNSIDSFSILNSTNVIYDGAFKNCNNIKSIVIPDNIMHIGGGAFSDCDNLISAKFDVTSGWKMIDPMSLDIIVVPQEIFYDPIIAVEVLPLSYSYLTRS